jgi:hopanoid-associated phosphorylase
VTCLALEARIALGVGVSVICNHASQLVASLEAAVERGASGIISFGIAGGLAPDLVAGSWVVGTGVQTNQTRFPADPVWTQRLIEALPGAVHADIAGVDSPIAAPLEKARLYARTGTVAVDTESHIAARIAAAHRIPFAAYRVVIDAAGSELPPAAVGGLRQDGTPDVAAVFCSVMRQPRQIPALARTARDARIAASALLRGRRLLGAGFSCPYFGGLAHDVLVRPAPRRARDGSPLRSILTLARGANLDSSKSSR